MCSTTFEHSIAFHLMPVAQASAAQADKNITFKPLTTRINHAVAWKVVEVQLWSQNYLLQFIYKLSTVIV